MSNGSCYWDTAERKQRVEPEVEQLQLSLEADEPCGISWLGSELKLPKYPFVDLRKKQLHTWLQPSLLAAVKWSPCWQQFILKSWSGHYEALELKLSLQRPHGVTPLRRDVCSWKRCTCTLICVNSFIGHRRSYWAKIFSIKRPCRSAPD